MPQENQNKETEKTETPEKKKPVKKKAAKKPAKKAAKKKAVAKKSVKKPAKKPAKKVAPVKARKKPGPKPGSKRNKPGPKPGSKRAQKAVAGAMYLSPDFGKTQLTGIETDHIDPYQFSLTNTDLFAMAITRQCLQAQQQVAVTLGNLANAFGSGFVTKHFHDEKIQQLTSANNQWSQAYAVLQTENQHLKTRLAEFETQWQINNQPAPSISIS